MAKKKSKQGGPREGAGRPVTAEATVLRRIPVTLVQKIDILIEQHKKRNSPS